MRIAVIGLGNTGRAMAPRRLHAGFELIDWNRTASWSDELAAGGAKRADLVEA